MNKNDNKIEPFLKVPVIKVEQPLGVFYACNIRSDILEKISFSSRAEYKRKDIVDGVFSLIKGNQREINEDRSKEISKYIDSVEATFPNSIILGANVNKDGNFVTNNDKKWHIINEKGVLYLIIPNDAKLATIIDGQHRLSGFKFSERKNMDMLCSVFIDLPAPYQAYIFASININQKRVNKSLAYELYGFKLEEEKRDLWSPEKLAVYIARKLNYSDSPLKNKIKLGADIVDIDENGNTVVSEHDATISLSTIVDGILKLISSNPKRDRDLLLNYKNTKGRKGLDIGTKNTPLRSKYISGDDESIENIVLGFIESIFEIIFNKQKHDSYILRNIGYNACFDLLKEYLKQNSGNFDKNEFSDLINSFSGFNFSDNFFTASGIGITRMKNIMFIKCGFKDLESLKEHKDYKDYKRLID